MSVPRASWREPMLWLIVALPLATICASIVMIRLALRDPADASGNDTRRIAQIQIEDLSWSREAARRGIRAELEADPLRGDVRVRLSPRSDASTPLELVMRHPTRADRDRRLPLVQDGARWHARTAPWSATQAWELQLSAPAQGWRIAGRLAPRAAGVTLVAAVAP